MLGLSKTDINLTGDKTFDFKWIDNIPKSSDDVMDFIGNGDAAPNGRFNYRYLGEKLSTINGVKSAQSMGLKLNAKNNGNATILQVQVPVAGSLTLKVFDLSGKEVYSNYRPNVEQGVYNETLQLPMGTFVAKCSMSGVEGILKFINHPQKARE
jgi:hypothetical protein